MKTFCNAVLIYGSDGARPGLGPIDCAVAAMIILLRRRAMCNATRSSTARCSALLLNKSRHLLGTMGPEFISRVVLNLGIAQPKFYSAKILFCNYLNCSNYYHLLKLVSYW